MQKISIVTDTDASLTVEMAAKYNIRQVPISINFGQQALDACVEINDSELFARIDQEGSLPTTAAPSPGKFAEAFKAAFEEDQADAVICFVVSGEVSGTYDAALIAANELLPDKNITVVDTLSLSLGQGYMALAAAQAAQNGASVDEAVQAAKQVSQRTHLYAALSTLKYLAMGGRVGHLSAQMAGLLSIKPILTIIDGKLEMLEKVRTRKKAWARTIELAAQAAGDQPIEQMSVVHVDALAYAREFEVLLRENLNCPAEITISELTPGLSAHSGPGFVAVVLVAGQ